MYPFTFFFLMEGDGTLYPLFWTMSFQTPHRSLLVLVTGCEFPAAGFKWSAEVELGISPVSSYYRRYYNGQRVDTSLQTQAAVSPRSSPRGGLWVRG